jgi:peptide/nickel transport system substrate-binding protein
MFFRSDSSLGKTLSIRWHMTCLALAKLKLIKKTFILRNTLFSILIFVGIFSNLGTDLLQAETDNEKTLQLPSKTLQLGAYSKPDPFNPFKTTDTIAVPVMDLIFNKLIRRNKKGEFEPDLAEKWQISEDGLTYTFYIRKGVTFHDGFPCTAEDVLYTYQLFSDPNESPFFYDRFNLVEEWKMVSDSVFQVVLKKPFSPFLYLLWKAYIVPKHRLKNAKTDMKHFERHPIGTGPFQFSTQSARGEILLQAYGDYYEGRPNLDAVHIQMFEEKGQIWSAFLRDEVDMTFYLDQRDYLEIRDNPAFQIFEASSIAGYGLTFNVHDAFLSDPRVREAIDLALDRQEMMDLLENERGLLSSAPFYPNSWAYDPNIKPTPFNPEKAQVLLSDAGFDLRDGLLEKDGKKFTLNLTLDPNNEHLYRMAKVIRQQLQEIGITTKIHSFSNDQELKRFIADPESGFQAYLIVFNSGTDPDTQSNYWETKAAFNWGNYKNDEMNKLFEEGRRFPSLEKRAKIYQEIHRILAREKPAIYFYYPYVYHATSRSLSNIEDLSTPYFEFQEFKQVIKTNERR